MKWHVYFASASDGSVKIGTSNDPKRRLRQLSRDTGLRLRLLSTIDCRGRRSAYLLEQRLLLHFRLLRRHGEWFTPDDELMEAASGALPMSYRRAPPTVLIRIPVTRETRRALQLAAAKHDDRFGSYGKHIERILTEALA